MLYLTDPAMEDIVSAAGRGAPRGSMPNGRLLTLWDIMRPLLASLFMALARNLEQTRLMQQNAPNETLPPKAKASLLTTLSKFDQDCADLELNMTRYTIREMQQALAKDVDYSKLGPLAEKLQDRLIDETRSRLYLALNVREATYFEPQEPLFGTDVVTKFPSVTYEIEEAGKCLALGRSTAAAFHSLRSLEAGLRALARCLGIPDPTKGIDRSWGSVLRAIVAQIDLRWPKNTPARMSDECRLFEDTYAALAGMMNPWRNAGMHLDHKYTEEEAKHIFEVVGGFMKKVASRMDENGDPPA